MRVKGFTLVELMVVVLVLSVLMWEFAGVLQRQQEVDNYVMSVENDAHVLDVVAVALEKYVALEPPMSPNAKKEVDLSHNSFTKFLPTGFVSTPLPSGMALRAYILNAETYSGSGEYVKKAIILPVPSPVGGPILPGG